MGVSLLQNTSYGTSNLYSSSVRPYIMPILPLVIILLDYIHPDIPTMHRARSRVPSCRWTLPWYHYHGLPRARKSVFLANVAGLSFLRFWLTCSCPSKMDGVSALVTSFSLPHSCASASACAVLSWLAVSVCTLLKDWASSSSL